MVGHVWFDLLQMVFLSIRTMFATCCKVYQVFILSANYSLDQPHFFVSICRSQGGRRKRNCGGCTVPQIKGKLYRMWIASQRRGLKLQMMFGRWSVFSCSKKIHCKAACMILNDTKAKADLPVEFIVESMMEVCRAVVLDECFFCGC